MNLDRHLDDDLPGILAELGAGSPPAYAGRIIERTSRTRQRPAWMFPSRWARSGLVQPGTTAIRWHLVGAVALVLLALLLAVGIVAGSRRPTLPPPFGPAHNGAIVYAEAGDIFLGDPTTGDTRAIVTDSSFDSHPQFSPDGSLIGFLRAVGVGALTATDVVVARADGTDARVITAPPLAAPPTSMLWAPDGKSITLLFTSGTPGLLVFDVAGPGKGRSISPPGLTIDSNPWAYEPPEGRRILFRATDTGHKIGLYVMNADGTGLQTLVGPFATTSDVAAQHDLMLPSWSPDGTRIAYQRTPADGSSMDIWLMNADGSNARIIGHSPGDTFNGSVSWSPDGRRIAFGRYIVDAAGNPVGYRYRVVRIEDGSVVDTGPAFTIASVESWSPDGNGIIVIFSDGQRPLLLDANGGAERRLDWAQPGKDWQTPVGGFWQRRP